MPERPEVRQGAHVVQRGQRPLERDDADVHARLADGKRLPVRPDAPGGIGRSRVVLRENSYPHGVSAGGGAALAVVGECRLSRGNPRNGHAIR
jgi:hypothetical protein